MIQSRRDFVFGCATFGLAVGYYLLASQIPESQLSDAVGPQGLPRIYALLLGALSLILIATSVRAPSQAPVAGSPEPRARSRVLGPAGVIVIGAVYISVVQWLGYVVSLAALIAATTYHLGGGFGRRVALVALSGALLFWLLFVAILGIQHPAGFWPSLF